MTFTSTPADSRQSGNVLETERLLLRHYHLEDDAFVVILLNDPAFLRYIGDRNVRTLEDARAYLEKGPLASYERLGYGLYLTLRKTDRTPLGMCGLLKRDYLPDPDIGFAFLPEFCGQGFAKEAAEAVIAEGRGRYGIARLLAVTDQENVPSIRLLERLGFRYEGLVSPPESGEELRLMARDL